MCLSGGSTKAPAVQRAPDRDTTAAAAVEARRRMQDSQGVYSNIATSPLGDSSYGTKTGPLPSLAAFGTGVSAAV